VPEAARAIGLLGRTPLFSDLPAESLRLVAGHSLLLSFAPGERIFEQGSEAAELFIVESGVVSVRKRLEDDTEQELAQFVAGELFGEVDLVDTVPRSASAVAMEASSLLVFPGPQLPFRRLAEQQPEVFAPVLHALLAAVAGRIRAANRLVSERAPWVNELQRQLYRDKLTGLLNRTWLDEQLDVTLRGLPRATFLVEKPDNFKVINDRWGHSAGDAGIVMLAEAARSALGAEAVICRYRGDELAILLAGLGEEEATERAEQLLEAIRAIDTSAATGGVPVALTSSIGLAPWAGACEKGKELVERAFALMLEARTEGGDRTRCS
jgi:diguanylate cyclase (GGDEF)-like protein